VVARSPQRVPTIKEVASRAGVALSSVSRVLNDHPDVSAEMRARVLRAVDELGYEPDLLASSLRRGQTKTVGFIVADIVNPLFAHMLRGAERQLHKAGYSVLVAHSEGDPNRDAESARLFRRRRVDGLLLSLTDEGRPDTLQELDGLAIPIVLLDREVADGTEWSAVLSDHRTGLRRATEHLIDLGHTDIVLVTGQERSRPARERVAGFLEAHQRRGIAPASGAVTHGNFSSDFGSRVVEAMVVEGRLPTALIVGGNLILNGVIASLHRHDVRIGRDIALITCDDIPLAEFHDPPISVVSRDIDEMGELAARLLLELLAGGAARTETVPTAFVVRESTFARR
jgi:LacI family transcriptional regulator